jgi:hypothetical protein
MLQTARVAHPKDYAKKSVMLTFNYKSLIINPKDFKLFA